MDKDQKLKMALHEMLTMIVNGSWDEVEEKYIRNLIDQL